LRPSIAITTPGSATREIQFKQCRLLAFERKHGTMVIRQREWAAATRRGPEFRSCETEGLERLREGDTVGADAVD
jgi:hypothetical protein